MARVTWGTLRHNAGSILVFSAVIHLPLTALGVVLEADTVQEWMESTDSRVLVAVLGGLLAAIVVDLFGHELLVGFTEKMVSREAIGHPVPPLGRLLRSLPLVRMSLAALLLGVVVGVGAVFAVVPGVVLFVLFGFSGALVVMERRGVFSAFGRSAAIAWGRWIGVIAVVLVPVWAIQALITDVLPEWLHERHLPSALEIPLEYVLEVVLSPIPSVLTVAVLLEVLRARGEAHIPHE